MEQGKLLKFLVKGSAKEPYRVTFWREENNFRSACTCPAGKKGSYCKHRFQLLDGDVTNLVSENLDDLVLLSTMIEGTDVDEIYEKFNLIKKYEATFKKINSLIKKDINCEKNLLNFPSLEQDYFILKFGVLCYFFKPNYECLGFISTNITQLKKAYPDLLTTKRIPALFTYSKEIIECVEKYNPVDVKIINEAMKKAMR